MGRILKALSLAASMLVAATGGAMAQSAADEWPKGPVKVIVTYPPGGASDLMTRAMVDALNKRFDIKMVVENRGGASGTIGLNACAKARPDGSTFCTFTPTSFCILPHLRSLPFAEDSFESVGRYSDILNAYSTSASAPWKSIPELMEAAKKNPGGLKMGSSGIGTTTHLAELAFLDAAKISLTHVPYANAAELITEAMAGRLALIYESTAFQQYRAGNIRILAVSAPHPNFPELPVMSQFVSGASVPQEFAMYAPKGTPKEIIAKLSRMMNEVVETPELKGRLLEVGAVTRTDTPETARQALNGLCENVNTLVKKFSVKPN